jgi:endonuclease-3
MPPKSAAKLGKRMLDGAAVANIASSSSNTVKAGPPGWELLYNKVVEMRRQVVTPVDVIGCDKLWDTMTADPEARRFQTLVALMLSAQTRDYCTAEAMCELMDSPGGLTPKSIAKKSEAEVNACIRTVGMHNNKAKYLKATADVLLAKHDGCVPRSLDALLSLPGVGPKMAHLFLQCADNVMTSGIGVDVHVHRISQRFKWVPKTVKTPEDTRKELEKWLPRKHWAEINEILVGFGQTICTPRNPKCDMCAANALCPSAFKECSASALERQKSRSLSRGASDGSSLARRVSSSKVQGASPNADDLLDLCSGSAEELLGRGWLARAVPAPAIPQNWMRRLSSSDQLAGYRVAQADVEAARKSHRAEVASSPAAAPSVPSHGQSWQLADIEDVVVSRPARGARDTTAPDTTAPAPVSGVASRYFTKK